MDNPMSYFGLKKDPTLSAVMIDYAHHKVHTGEHYFYADTQTLGENEKYYYCIKVPAAPPYIHFWFDFESTTTATLTIYEDDTGFSVPVDYYNNNRNSLNAGSAALHATDSHSPDGTVIFVYSGGSLVGNARTGFSASNGEEIILMAEKRYVIGIVSGGKDNLCSIKFEWYEQTN